jgi:hypothetical protein
MRCALLVANQDVVQLRELRQDVVERHDRAAWQAEDRGYALFGERLTYGSSSVQAHHIPQT